MNADMIEINGDSASDYYKQAHAYVDRKLRGVPLLAAWVIVLLGGWALVYFLGWLFLRAI